MFTLPLTPALSVQSEKRWSLHTSWGMQGVLQAPPCQTLAAQIWDFLSSSLHIFT